MKDPNIILYCPACGREYDVADGHFACPEVDGTGEHVLDKVVLRHPDADAMRLRLCEGSPDGFSVFRDLFGSHAVAGDDAWLGIHDRIQAALREYEGKGFEVTPLNSETALADALGVAKVLAKDETGNITGSHKGRHLMGTLLYLESLREKRGGDKPELAVYSCGNAALAASAVARAGGYTLHAYVPDDVAPLVDRMLHERGAVVEKFGRNEGQTGDPCYLAFTDDLKNKGYVPFSCSGTDNWSNIEGGETLGLETVMQLADMDESPDHAVVHVGGGALGRSLVKAFQEARMLGLMERVPRIHACQPEGGFPFVRAYFLVLGHIAERAGLEFDLAYDRQAEPAVQLAALKEFQAQRTDMISAVAEFAREHFNGPEVRETLAEMACDRRAFMWPWDGGAPHSLAHGILDDETYDWYYLLEGMLRTGGRAVVLSEEAVADANRQVSGHCASPVCPTGTAGVAGLMELKRLGTIKPEDDILVLFTGALRK